MRGTAEGLAGLQGGLAEPPGAEKSCSESSPLNSGSQGQMTSALGACFLLFDLQAGWQELPLVPLKAVNIGREAARGPQCTGGGSRLRFPSMTPSAPPLPPQPQA